MYETVIESYRQAARANRESPLRKGNVLHLPAGVELLLTGDLHGNGPNLLKMEKFADLDARPQRHLLLQEIIHPTLADGQEVTADQSHHVLTRVARLQCRYPGRVHVILGNHEMSQMTGQDILKSGASICRAFVDGVNEHYADEADDALAAMYDYFRSQPLAVRTSDGLVAVHSLPADRVLDRFDATVFDRPMTDDDFVRSGPAYQLVWGRSIGEAAVIRLREVLDAKMFVIGHQPQPAGISVERPDLLIIASDHSAGVVLAVPPGPLPPADSLAASAVRLNAIDL